VGRACGGDVTANAVPYAVQALSHPADNFRRALRFSCQGQQGVRSWVTNDLLVQAQGTPNMSVLVNAGECVINGTQNVISQGSYHGLNDASVGLTIAASDPTNPRIDIVVAQVEDAAYSGSNNDFKLAVITGTPAASPSAPATPNNAIVLAQVSVAANATSVTSGNVTDKRPQWGLPYHAEVYLGANQTGLTAGNSNFVNWDTILSDPAGGYTTGRYTVPVPGRWRVTTHIWVASVADGVASFHGVAKNGTESARLSDVTSGATSNKGQGGSAVVRCNATDYLGVIWFPGSGGPYTLTAGANVNWAAFEYVGPN